MTYKHLRRTILGVPPIMNLNLDLLDILLTAVKRFSSYFWPYMIPVNLLGKIANFTVCLEEQKYKSVIT